MRFVKLVVLAFLTSTVIGAFSCIVLAAGIEVTAEGMAMIKGDLPAARDAAIHDAMRKGVEQALGTMIDSMLAVRDAEIVNDSILSKSQGYISSYTIEKEWQEDGIIHVSVKMTIKQGYLANDLQAIEIALRRAGDPRVGVLISESAGWLRGDPVVETAIQRYLREYGFRVVLVRSSREIGSGVIDKMVKGDAEAIREVGQALEAEILVLGTAKVYQVSEYYGLYQYAAKVELRTVLTGTAEVGDSFSLSAKEANFSQVKAADMAINAVAKQTGIKLRQVLFDQFNSLDRLIKIDLCGVSFADVQDFERRVRNVRFVKQVQLRQFNNGTATFDVRSELDSTKLATELSYVLSREYAIIGVGSNSLTLEKNN